MTNSCKLNEVSVSPEPPSNAYAGVIAKLYSLTLYYRHRTASQQPVAGARPTIALIVDLSEFTPHCSTVDDSKESEQEPSHYTYPCRCSSTFVITTAELEQGVDIIQCGGCTERCRVEYQEVE